MNRLLVTGYPSLLARHVVREALSVRGAALEEVVVVVSPKARPEADQAIALLPADQGRRVCVLDGEVGAIDFGLSGAEYKDLARRVTHVHHCAHVAHLGVDRETAQAVNLGATKEVLEFATTCSSLTALVHHSTAFVSGTRAGVVHEHELEAGQGFRSVVEETRARAEKLVRRFAARVPTVIVRPSTIVGDSVTGEIDRLEGVYLLAGLLLDGRADFAVPAGSRWAHSVHLVPVDYVARAAVALGFRSASLGATFHLVDPAPPTQRALLAELARLAGTPAPKRFLPESFARVVLRAPGMQRFAPGPLGLLADLSSEATYDDRAARGALADSGITCPPFDEYAPKIVEASAIRRRPAPSVPDEAELTSAPAESP